MQKLSKNNPHLEYQESLGLDQREFAVRSSDEKTGLTVLPVTLDFGLTLVPSSSWFYLLGCFQDVQCASSPTKQQYFLVNTLYIA